MKIIKWPRVPRTSAILLATFAHVFVIFLMLPAREKGAVHLVPQEFQKATTSGGTRLIYRSKNSILQARAMRVRRNTPALAATSGSDAQTAALNALRQQASKGARSLTRALWFRQIYGFYPGHDYQLAFRTSGEVHIPAEELPPHFEQFVTVEVTIDADGHVADARRVSGMVPAEIEQKLLSEVREFKYHPATRDGQPIPTQLDVVIHIPS